MLLQKQTANYSVLEGQCNKYYFNNIIMHELHIKVSNR